MGDGIDEVALPAVEIDVLDNPNQIQNHSRQQKREQDRANAEQNPINLRTIVLLRIQRAENVQQNPADRQPHNTDYHQCRYENRPLQTLSLKQSIASHTLFHTVSLTNSHNLLQQIHQTHFINPVPSLEQNKFPPRFTVFLPTKPWESPLAPTILCSRSTQQRRNGL